MLTLAAVTTPSFTVSAATAVTIAAAVLAVVDSALRFRRPGGTVLAIIALVLGLLLLVRVFGPLQTFVSTSIPVLYLSVALTVVLLVEMLVKAARRSGILWLTIVATLVCGAAAVIAFLKVG